MSRPSPVALDALPPGAFHTVTRVMFAHCDPAGIVFTPRFVELVHGAIEVWVQDRLGFDYDGLIRGRRLGLGYAHVEVDFFTPAFVSDRLRFTVLIERIGNGSVTLAVHGHRDATPVLRANMVMVTTDLDRHRAIPLPDWLRAAIAEYRAECGAAWPEQASA